MPFTASSTCEMYVGPAFMIFRIPYKLANLTVFVTTTPVEGGSLMRVRTFLDNSSWIAWMVGWLVMGVSASQLAADIEIMTNKIRLRKPFVQPNDGPYMRTNRWLKMFFSASSNTVGKEAYAADW